MKNPENMTPDERLKRIRSLERKVADLERDKDWAQRDEASVRRWAEEAWTEVRRLHDMCTLHWNEKQEIRRAAGLDPQPTLVPKAVYNSKTRQWEPLPEEPSPVAAAMVRNGWTKQMVGAAMDAAALYREPHNTRPDDPEIVGHSDGDGAVDG